MSATNERQPAGNQQNSWVYFIQGEYGGPIKIGFTSDHPDRRLAALQIGSPVRLRLVGLIGAGVEMERAIHVQFAHVRLHGEWFQNVPKLVQYIESLALHSLATHSPHGKHRFQTVAEVAKQFQTGRRRIEGWITSGRLPAIDLNPNGKRRHWRIDPVQLERFTQRMQGLPIEPQQTQIRKPVGRPKRRHV